MKVQRFLDIPYCREVNYFLHGINRNPLGQGRHLINFGHEQKQNSASSGEHSDTLPWPELHNFLDASKPHFVT